MYNKMKRNKKMMHDYIFIVVFVGIFLIGSFMITEYIAITSTMEQSRYSAGVIYRQAMEQLNQVEEDIKNLRLNILSNDSSIAFMESSNFSTRWEKFKEVQQMVGNNRRINKYLENIMLYDDKGELFFALGEVFSQKITINQEKSLTFSGRIWDKAEKKTYYEVGIPIYIKKEDGSYKNSGSAYLLFNAGNLQDIVNKALLNADSTIALIDQNNKAIVKAGNWKSSYGLLKEKEEDNKRLVYVDTVGSTGWRMVNVIPKKALLRGVSRLQKITYATDFAVILTMAFLCIMIYRRIIRPISRQTVFMTSYVKDTKQRIEVIEKNEIGLMAEKMNQMLDDIENLNSKIIESNRRYLELNYAKKQTEMVAFRSQINPHFLSNTFECIRGMALNHGEREIADLTKSLSNIFRYNVKGEDMATMLDELRNLQEYAKIINYRFCGKHQINIDAQRDIFLYKIPKMVLQPLVENAVFHGLETKVEGGRVNVEIREENKKLVIRVMDDGLGIPLEQQKILNKAMESYDENGTIPDQHQGIGFLNVYRRLHLFYGDNAKLLLESKEMEGTCITLIVPAM
jgi:Predicted signal transduction protein with a C-terminal ATPase domain